MLLDESMPTEPEPTPTALARKPWLAGCTLHVPPSFQGSFTMLWLDGHPVKALLDSGSTITLAWPWAFPMPATLCGTVKVTCVHGDA